MRRTASNTNDSNNQQLLLNPSEQNNSYQKRSLEDYGFSMSSKRRRHLSPQNDNIELTQPNDVSTPNSLRKKLRIKQKTQTLLDSPSLDISLDGNSMPETPNTRVSW